MWSAGCSPQGLLAGRLPGLTLAALLAVGCAPAPTGRTVLLLSLDTARADFADPRDAETMPELHRLAERGTWFSEMRSGTSWTLPSHAQMFTGQPPALHGVQDDNLTIDPLTPTLPELFGDAGWQAFGVYSGPYLFSDFGFGRGFRLYQNALPGGEEMELAFRQAANRDDFELQQSAWRGAEFQSHRAVSSVSVADSAIASLGRVEGDADLLLFAHFFDPHYDYVPPAPYDTRFDPDYTGDIDGAEFYLNPRVRDRQPPHTRRLSDRDLQHILALYRGELAWTDHQIGRVLDALEQAGRLDSAFVVVTGDHGEEFFEHGSIGHRKTLYGEQLRVPLMLVPPSGAYPAAARTSTASASLSDLLPTLLGHFGIDSPPSIAGRSLLPVLAGDGLDPRASLASLRQRPLIERIDGADAPAPKHRFAEALIDGTGGKLVREYVVQAEERRLLGLNWYDLEADPAELSPITDPADPRLIAGWQALESELARLQAVYEATPQSPPADRASTARDLFEGQLEALGYADGGPDETVALDSSDAADALPWGLAPPPPWPLDSAVE